MKELFKSLSENVSEECFRDMVEKIINEVSVKRWNEALSESKPKDPEGYKKNIEIANHYDHLYSTSPAKSPDGGPNSVAAEWNRRYQEYFNKAMKCYYGDGSKEKKVKNPANEAFTKAISLMEAIINEISDERKLKGIKFGVDKFKEMRDNIDNEVDPNKKADLEDEAVKYGHRVNVQIDRINAKQINKIKNKGKDEKNSEETEEPRDK